MIKHKDISQNNLLKNTLLELIYKVLPIEPTNNKSVSNADSISEFKDENLLKELAERINTSEYEAKVFAIIFSGFLDDGEIFEKEIAKKLNITLPCYDVLYTNLKSLYEKGLIMKSSAFRNRINYFVGSDIQKMVFENRSLNGRFLKTDVFGLAENAIGYYKMLNDGYIDTSMHQAYLKKLLEINAALPLSKIIKKLRLPDDEAMLLFALYCCATEGESTLNLTSYLSGAYRQQGSRMNIKRKLQSGKAHILTAGLIQLEESNFRVAEDVSFTDEGLNAVFGKDKLLLDIAPANYQFPGLILAKDIRERNLFYNSMEEESINRLIKILDNESFCAIQKKLSSEGMMPGMAILLYGSPGTGKTESVYQAARITGRDILKVDISSIRDKYIGESEKRTRKIFDDYRKCMKRPGHLPILFLNEADAIFGKRINISDSTDQMNNTMQNIILEEMENFQGIMFCTTNLESNLDPAFERRFLYKIKFNLPSDDVRAAILRERISILSGEQAIHLSSRYLLSGGQIDNIHRKLISERLLNETEPSFEYIERLCGEESLLQKPGLPIIGGFLKNPDENKFRPK